MVNNIAPQKLAAVVWWSHESACQIANCANLCNKLPMDGYEYESSKNISKAETRNYMQCNSAALSVNCTLHRQHIRMNNTQHIKLHSSIGSNSIGSSRSVLCAFVHNILRLQRYVEHAGLSRGGQSTQPKTAAAAVAHSWLV